MKHTVYTILSITLLCSTNSMANTANSDYSCHDIPGHWSGTGQATQGRLTCKYQGEGNFVHVGGSNYQGNLNLKFLSGPSLCPKTLNTTLNGTCSNNQLTINNEDVYLTGTLQHKFVQLKGYSKEPKSDIIANLQQD